MIDKNMQRQSATAARRALPPEERLRLSAQICQTLQTLPVVRNARTVLSYMAMADEVDLEPLHIWLRQRGCRLAFPRSLPRGILEAWEPGAWQKGPYGIWEPDPSRSRRLAPAEPDLVLVPCVAFDQSNMRLGHGAGYYDRYLPHCPQAVAVCVAFEAQRMGSVACGPHDLAMDYVVTESGIFGKISDSGA